MSSFDFVGSTLPGLHADCVRAESYLATDPLAACFYTRRVAEDLVGQLYDILQLPAVPQAAQFDPDLAR